MTDPIEAALEELRDRRLLKWLFARDADTNPVPIGYVEGPIDLATQREVVGAVVTAYLKAVKVEGSYTLHPNWVRMDDHERADAEQFAQALLHVLLPKGDE